MRPPSGRKLAQNREEHRVRSVAMGPELNGRPGPNVVDLRQQGSSILLNNVSAATKDVVDDELSFGNMR